MVEAAGIESRVLTNIPWNRYYMVLYRLSNSLEENNYGQNDFSQAILIFTSQICNVLVLPFKSMESSKVRN